MTAEQAADLSRRHVIAGLIVRGIDLLLCDRADAQYRLCMVAVPFQDVGQIGPLVTASRKWQTLTLPDTSSATASLRALARLLDADHTGNLNAIELQIHRALMLRAGPAVVTIEGTVAIGRCLPSLLQLGRHRRLRLIAVSDGRTVARAVRPPASLSKFPPMETIPDREHAAERLLCLGRTLTRLRLARTT